MHRKINTHAQTQTYTVGGRDVSDCVKKSVLSERLKMKVKK